jgi:transcriptional regulator with XRE-family HTH domain
MADNISNMLRAFRTKLRITQAEMAERIGASRQQYANWEYGRSQPTGHYIDKLESLGFSSTWSPFDDVPTRIRATRRQLQLLIGIVADCSISDTLRANAKEELEKALGLDSSD